MSERLPVQFDPGFYRNRNVFVTGHTGFKGSWLCCILSHLGANVSGYALAPQDEPNLYSIAHIDRLVSSTYGDIRDFGALQAALHAARPEIVIHMAAQPLVRESYNDPRYTYETNVMGTVNICEAVRHAEGVRSFLNVTTDKVYLNNDLPDHAFKEDDKLDGFDPYSNSKSCSELVTHSYASSFLTSAGCATSTARAGNVIGGGDFSKDRIIPDCVRAVQQDETIIVRSPGSTRPYQHVLEPLFGYLMIAQGQYEQPGLAGWYNIGPDERDCWTTGMLVDEFCKAWGGGATWEARPDGGPHEAGFLQLDSAKLKQTFGWAPRWDVREAITKTVEWTKAWLEGRDVLETMTRQIDSYR